MTRTAAWSRQLNSCTAPSTKLCSVQSTSTRRFRCIAIQYRMARGFILPLAILAFILPLWAPVAALDGVGSIGPFPIIRSQVFMVSLLASAVSFVAFQERAYRYSAAKG